MEHQTSDKDFSDKKVPNSQRSKKKEKNNIGCVGWTGIIAVAFILLVMIFDGNDGGSGSSYEEPQYDKGMAWQMTQDFVKKRLKSPSTAEFPWSSDVDIKQNGKTFEIDGYVDAQNSFGAQIRKEFKATVKYSGNGTWNLVDLNFE